MAFLPPARSNRETADQIGFVEITAAQPALVLGIPVRCAPVQNPLVIEGDQVTFVEFDNIRKFRTFEKLGKCLRSVVKRFRFASGKDWGHDGTVVVMNGSNRVRLGELNHVSLR
jgi:hypothetical protein